MSINTSKSKIYMANVPEGDRRVITTTLNLLENSPPFKYLWIHLVSKNLKFSDCLPLLSSLEKKIMSWHNKFLSFGGRLQLISSFLTSTLNYWCTHFSLPSGALNTIENLLRNFLWGGVTEYKGPKVTFKEICTPKGQGGLGIKRPKDINIAFLLKLGWKLINMENKKGWVSWVHLNLLKGHGLWAISKKRSSTRLWKEIIKLRPLLAKRIDYSIGKGDDIFFWFDPWHNHQPLCNTTPPHLTVDFGLASNIKLKDILSPRTPSPHTISSTLSNLYPLPPLSDADDVIYWLPSKSKTVTP